VYDHLPSTDVLYFDDSDQLYMEYDRCVRMLVCPSKGYVRVSFLHEAGERTRVGAYPLFTIALIELTKRHGLYFLHGAGLCLGEKALVLSGTSGSGKTTLVLALLRAGFDLLADDTLFLVGGGDELQMLGFPDAAGVSDHTVHLFPEVQPYLRHSPPPRGLKRLVHVEEVYGTAIRRSGQPAAVVFPSVRHMDTSTLTPLAQNEAFFELIGHLLPTEIRSSQAHLDILARLARVPVLSSGDGT
jgi:hypothetical protein